uniref:Uncharacterized protein LOC105033431 n=1 Tax=Elaeis guineensis var. tenera TaxID=51953 RepID=A0A6I9QBC7_ELAGV|nr:uncharacterized protein LOC105033431 [Elaeis guineensis]
MGSTTRRISGFQQGGGCEVANSSSRVRKFVNEGDRICPGVFFRGDILESKDLSDYSLHELLGSLQSHEQRMNRTTEASLEQAFQSRIDIKGTSLGTGRGGNGRGHGRGSHGRGRGRSYGQQRNRYGGNDSNFPSCFHCGKSNHEEKDCWYKNNKSSSNKKGPQCYNCKEYGHTQVSCPWKAKEQANYHEEDAPTDDNLFVTCFAANLNISEEVWW